MWKVTEWGKGLYGKQKLGMIYLLLTANFLSSSNIEPLCNKPILSAPR
jgi:hypothetical protein